jgi:integrase
MAALSQLPSGKWRAQVRRAGFYKGETFALKRDAEAWARETERQAEHVVTGGFAPIPKGTTVGDLIDLYRKQQAQEQEQGRTKAATLEMLKREIGRTPLAELNATTLRDLIDRRTDQGAGGVTIAADLSYLSAVLKWRRHARRLDIPDRLALEAREGLKHRGLKTRGQEREREPTDAELARLYAHWTSKPRQRINMTTLCKLALATGMRLGEICSLQIEDIDRDARTVVVRDRKDPRNKSGNNQTLPLLPEAWAIVKGLIEGRTEGAVFPAQAASASTAFTRACADLQPPILDLHFHDLRHRATAQFFRMGLDVPRVALLTGHKTWAMLRRYTDIKPTDVHAVVDQTKAASKRAKR